jgi:hypothetical protein
MERMTWLILLLVIVLAPVRPAHCQNPAAQANEKVPLTTAEMQAVVTGIEDERVFQALLQKLPRIELVDHTGQAALYYLLEGDVMATASQVRARLRELHPSQAAQKKPASPGELLVMTDEQGHDAVWPPGKRNLTYAIDRKRFSEADYQFIVAAMREAAKAWEEACDTCGISFQHRSELDNAPSTNLVTFVVSYVDTNRFIAAAFFPNDPPRKRFLVIGPQFFTTDFNRVGVLRHEIGHILGYRHMQIVGIPGCDTEDPNWRAVTAQYDRLSVMHYFCGGGGSRALDLSQQDRADHRKLYGGGR